MANSPTLNYADIVVGNSSVLIATNSLAQIIVTKASVVNTDSVNSHTFSIFRIPSDGSIGNSTLIIDAYPIAPKATIVLPLGGQVIAAGASFIGQADTPGFVNFNASYSSSLIGG